MGPLVTAWLVGEGIVIFRTAKLNHAPPGPGQLLFSSGAFVLLALLAESEKARSLATTLAWGFDVAAFLNLWGTGTGTPSFNNNQPVSAKKGGQWPPPIAPNTVIIPTGVAGKDENPVQIITGEPVNTPTGYTGGV